MKFETSQAGPWWIKRYVLRRTKEPCPELYKFESAEFSEKPQMHTVDMA